MSENKNHPLQKADKTNQSDWLKKLEQASGRSLSKGRGQSLALQNLDVVFIFNAA